MFQEQSTLQVIFFGSIVAMYFAVKLDAKPFAVAVKIEYVIFYAVLAPEFAPGELRVF